MSSILEYNKKYRGLKVATRLQESEKRASSLKSENLAILSFVQRKYKSKSG